ncbi:hydantoinase/oxoprolinase family protein [Actinomadura rayongensis]|uniref:Hydantoinase/oxoprolinase family protein n=1 Tax=Actinomadura rayongensis TaxID=1429076 RepID=A0A6I4WAD9_9ACTN|nr:hydantoinase/oxoprolinase family protein [Actinomadura rayongensis]
MAVDVGGTFVDVTLADLATGRRWVRKVLSDEGPRRAFVRGLEAVCADAGIAVGALDRVVHGMTLSTNAILQAAETGTAAVVTAGFRDVLEIGRHDAPRSGNTFRWLKPRRPVGRDRIVEVAERVTWDGTVLVPLTEAEQDAAVAALRALKPTAVAVSLLYGYAHPEHERRLAEAIRTSLPGVHVTCSHEVLPQAGEYERSTATVLNAYTMPSVSDYLTGLLSDLSDIGVRAPLYIMASDGGVLGAADAGRLPITTVLSGPAGGAAGAARFAAGRGASRILTLDVGGTSSDVACADDGAVDLTVDAHIGAFPVALPVLDVNTVGAGGGSIARAAGGRFTVGPASAGARPGPVCYGRGGTEPTVTDALLVLGWLPERIAGGALTLAREAAREAIRTRLAEPLGIDVTAAAAGTVRLANAQMADAIRRISTERGRDPRDYALLPFGGAGGLHAVEVARLLRVPRVLVPPAPGVFTTEGLLAADVRRHLVRSFPRPLPLGAAGDLDAAYADLERQAAELLDAGAATEGHDLVRYLDLRYAGQGYELIIEATEDVAAAFHDAHETRYRYRLPDAPVEIVRARLAVSGRLAHADRPAAEPAESAAGPGRRDLYFDGHGWLPATIHERAGLRPGDAVRGPAVVQEYDATTILPPGATAVVAADGALTITVTDEPERSA